MHLTKSVIDRARYEGDGVARHVLWDDALAGFGLRIYPTGRKAFIYSYRLQGRKRLYTIGDYGVLTLDQARNLAREAGVKVIQGTDPLAERKRDSQGETIKDLCRAFIERHSRPHKKSWREDERRLKKFITPIWGAHQIRSITREEVAQLHHRLGKKSGSEANRVLATLSKMFAMAKVWGMLSESGPNPARGIDKFREKRRDRWLTPEEMPELAKTIKLEPNIYIRSAIWLYLLTGLRRSELLRLRWEDVDLERKILQLPDTKADRAHYVPLSTHAVRYLRALPRLEGNPYVLPGHIKGRPLVNIGKSWRRIRDDAGVKDVRLHDLRRTLGSWMAQKGASLHLIGRVLNHTSPSTTKIYARFAEDNVRLALEQHSKAIVSAAKKKPKKKKNLTASLTEIRQ